MDAWRDVEVAAAEGLDGPTQQDLEAIRAATFTVEAVQEREAVTDHDVAAFVDVLGASAGPAGRWIHFGLTSSDVLDTALALQLRRAGEPIVAGARAPAAALASPAPAWSASHRRSATSSARRSARLRSPSAPARRARARCRTSATRSPRSGSPVSRASCAATPRPGWRMSRCGT